MNKPIHHLLILSLILSPLQISANHECQCYFCFYEEEIEEPIDYEELEEFGEIFKEFELRLEEENDTEDVQQRGFLKKWCKKLKKWFKKKTAKFIKKILKLRKTRNSEECAYTIAKFKRKIDKKIYKTGSLDKMFTSFEAHSGKDISESMTPFKNRIRFYYNNKDAKPPKNEHKDEKYDEVFEQLNNMNNEMLVGGVIAFSGALVMAIPLPGCAYLGEKLIDIGIGIIIGSWVMDNVVNYNDENPQQALEDSIQSHAQ